MNARARRGVVAAAGLFLAIQVGALALLPTFHAQGYQAVENPSDPVNSVVYVAAILVATGVMLAAFRYDLRWVVRGLITVSAAFVSWYVFGAFLGLLGLVPAALVAVALLAHPEWYVIDGAGVVMGAGAGALFGISFGPLPALLLLVVLAVYDALSVYGTEHMLDLAEGVMDLRLPVILVIPLSLSYSLLEDDFEGTADRGGDADGGTAADGDGVGTADGDGVGTADGDGVGTADGDGVGTADGDGVGTADEDPAPDGGGSASEDDELERDALFIGLGDAVIPTVLVASAAFFSPAPSLGVPGLAVNLPALLSMVGVFVGLGLLLRAVVRGRAHAGLPLLNGGAVAGYLLGSVIAGVPLVTALGLAPYL